MTIINNDVAEYFGGLNKKLSVLHEKYCCGPQHSWRPTRRRQAPPPASPKDPAVALPQCSAAGRDRQRLDQDRLLVACGSKDPGQQGPEMAWRHGDPSG